MKQICKKSAAGRSRLLLILLLSGLTVGCGSGQMVEVTGIQDLPTHLVQSTEHEAAAEGAAAAADSVTAAAADKTAAAQSIGAAAGQASAPESSAPDNVPVTAAKMVVYVRGAVNRPGVYQLEEDARIFCAIEAAGGFRADADTEWLNQAQPLFDGAMLTVSTREETAILRQAGQTDGSGVLISGSSGLTDSQGTAAGIHQGNTDSVAFRQVPEKNGRTNLVPMEVIMTPPTMSAQMTIGSLLTFLSDSGMIWVSLVSFSDR